MSINTTVIGPVVTAVASPPTKPPKPPRPGGGRSEFEIALSDLDPVAWYRFRQGKFTSNQNGIRDSSGNSQHMLPQIATVNHSSIISRTTHKKGGAYFPSVTHTNWATTGTEYKAAADNVLNGASAYTAVVSFRLIKKPTGNDIKMFAVGTEDVSETSTNDLVLLKADTNPPTEPHYWKHRTDGGALVPADFAVSERIEDGVNRLITVRYDPGTLFRMVSSRPGHEHLVEESATSIGSGLAALDRAILLNARTDTGTGTDTTAEFVVDQIALIESDIGAAAETDLHDKWYDEAIGAPYYPSMMEYASGYYNRAYTSSGNKITVVARFNRASFTGDTVECIARPVGPSNRDRPAIYMFSSDNTSSPNQADKITVVVKNSAGTNICRLVSPTGYLDGDDHNLFFAFDGDNGTAVFRIDGDDADDTGNADRVAPTTGTLDSGSGNIGVGAAHTGSFAGSPTVGAFGYRDAYLTNYSDFINSDDNTLPYPIDEKNWSEWDGRTAGDPGMTEFDGSTGYYDDAGLTVSGNKVTLVCRFNRSSFSGGSQEYAVRVRGDGDERVQFSALASDHAQTARQDRVQCQVVNSVGTVICRTVAEDGYLDGADHVLFFAFDGDAGTVTFKIDGVDAEDTDNADRVAPTTGTLGTAAAEMQIGAANTTPTNLWGGKLGFLGYRDAYLTNPEDFSTGSTPLDIDEANWTEWGAQPLFWNRTGEMSDNKGSAGNMTANGTIKPPRPLFWSHTGQMDNNKGSAGDMTANGTITMTEGGSP